MKLRLCFLFSLALTDPLAAHEFWLWPETFTTTPGATVQLHLRVGENYIGDGRPFNAARIVALRHFTTSGANDLLSQVPAAPGAASLGVVIATPGTHLFAYDGQPNTITLPPDQFLAYLNEDGLAHIAALRHAAGQDQVSGRERYQRFVKTLLLAGEKSDATYALRTGQRLEIVPLADPLAAHVGSRLGFTVLFNGQPLSGAVVRAWHHQGAELVALKSQTDSSGKVAFDFPFVGPWMISLVHMVPLQDVPGLDWESSWSSLTFALHP